MLYYRSFITLYSLKLNPSKTVFLPVSRFLNCSDFSALQLGLDCVISPAESARNLGIIFDTRMNFNKQISEVRKSAFYHLRRLNNIRFLHAFVTSRVD